MPAITLDQILQAFKTVSLVIGGGALVYKVVLFLDQAKKTIKAIPSFMDDTTKNLSEIHSNVNTAVTNHLSHMEDGIAKLAESTERLATTMESHVIKMAESQAIILDRLP